MAKKKKECHLIKFKDKSKEQVDLNSRERGNHIISIGKKKKTTILSGIW